MTRLLEKWTGSEIAVDDTGDWNPQLFLGGQPDEWLALYQQISPIVHVGADTPPTLQFMGEHEIYVARSGAVAALHDKLQEAGVPSVYVAFPRTDHAFDMFLPQLSPPAQTAMYYVDRFLALMAVPVDWKNAHRSVAGAAPEAVEMPVSQSAALHTFFKHIPFPHNPFRRKE